MYENAKEEMLKREGDAWFERNLTEDDMKISEGCLLFDEFLEKREKYMGGGKKKLKILEIGCCFGYNLMYLCDKYGFEGYGIEPSAQAVSYGNNLVKNKDIRIVLERGTADELPFRSDEFDIVMIGFCMYCIDRKYVMKVIAEIDRVLKTEGIMAAWDFDTRIPYRRDNIHNRNILTYKYDLTQFFLGNPQYWLMEKRMYVHDSENYTTEKLLTNMQDRCALNILYKDTLENAYIYN